MFGRQISPRFHFAITICELTIMPANSAAVTQPSPSSFARLSPWAARTVLAATALTITAFVYITLSQLASGFSHRARHGAGDVALYQAEVRRIAAGESYYEAASAELHQRGYQTRNLFNWRTPLPMWLLGIAGSELAGRLIIGSLAALTLLLAMVTTARADGIATAVLCGLQMIGALLPCWVDEIFVMPVVWAGVLIALSVLCYAAGRPALGVGCGLAALFMRELAAPYCLVCLSLAMYQRRGREVLAWLVGLGIYALFFAWHAVQVMQLIGPGDRGQPESWLQLGGAPFLIAVAQMNAYLLLLPQWVTAVYLPLAMLGFAGWNSPTGLRAGLTASVFLILFAFIGQPFNQYWGSLLAPLLCLGFVQAPAAVADLLRRALGRHASASLAVASL